MTDFDLSTIDREGLGRLARWSSPASYHLGSPGMGCYLDPPGYPTYFVQPVYTGHGHPPNRGTSVVLLGHSVQRADWKPGETWETREAHYKARLRRLYLPLPYDHPRVAAWEVHLYTHFRNCYKDTEELFPLEYGKPAIVGYPTPQYKLRTFVDRPQLSDDWRQKERAVIEQQNKDIDALHREVAVPERHLAVLSVREFYPDAPIRHDWIKQPPQRAGDWYERYAERPTPESCPGEVTFSPPKEHPVNGSWCQVCGYPGRER